MIYAAAGVRFKIDSAHARQRQKMGITLAPIGADVSECRLFSRTFTCQSADARLSSSLLKRRFNGRTAFWRLFRHDVLATSIY